MGIIILFRVFQGDGSLETLHRYNSVKVLKTNSMDGFLHRQLESDRKAVFAVCCNTHHSQYSPRKRNIRTGELLVNRIGTLRARGATELCQRMQTEI